MNMLTVWTAMLILQANGVVIPTSAWVYSIVGYVLAVVAKHFDEKEKEKKL